MNNLSVFCADVGSIKAKKFGWAARLSNGESILGDSIEEFSARISSEIKSGHKIALGFECPLFVPMRDNPVEVNSARRGDGNRSWSAGAGTGALATGLVEVLWVMNNIKNILGYSPVAEVNWESFLVTESVFLWEAFVSSTSKGLGHSDDANIAIRHFLEALPNPTLANAIESENILSLVGAAALRAGWCEDVSILSRQCIVIKA